MLPPRPPPVVFTSHTKILDTVLSLLRAGEGFARDGSKPGFSHALKLSYNTIAKERFSIGHKTLTYRYELCKDVNKPTVGLFCALQDDLSTLAIFSAGFPVPPGVSLQMQTELIEKKIPTAQVIDIANTVTKLGRSISHTRTDFFCAETKKLLAYSTHVKYMPTGSWFLDFLFRSKLLLIILRVVNSRTKPPLFYDEEKLADVIGRHLEFHGPGVATFHRTGEHTNPMGSLHGGCVAMIMEQVAENWAKQCLGVDAVLLEFMHIDFLSAVRGEKLEVQCETIGRDDVNGSLYVRVVQKSGEKIFSDGKLRFSKGANITANNANAKL